MKYIVIFCVLVVSASAKICGLTLCQLWTEKKYCCNEEKITAFCCNFVEYAATKGGKVIDDVKDIVKPEGETITFGTKETGITVGGVIVLILIVTGFYCCFRRKRHGIVSSPAVTVVSMPAPVSALWQPVVDPHQAAPLIPPQHGQMVHGPEVTAPPPYPVVTTPTV